MHPSDPSVDRNTAARRAPAARCAVLLAAFAAACSHDVGEGIVGRLERAVPVAPTDALVGLDPDLTPTAPLRDLSVAGVRLPRNGATDLTIAFVAFTTAAAADDGDGFGRALDRTIPPPADTNGQDDVFLAAVVNPERTFGGQAVPTAFVQGLAPIFRDARCTRCHSYHYPGGWREQGHVGAMPKGSNAQCVDCHSSGEILVAGRAPTSIAWLAPDAEQNHTPTQDFRGKTDRELFELATSVADPQGHLQNDDKILWAIAHGRVPFRGASVGGRVPMDPQQWQNLVEAWGQSGMPFSTTTAVDDIALASRRTAANSAGNGAASQPSVAFVPNAGYQPDAPTAAMLGTAYVAFASTSTNLTASATVRRDIFRSTFEAWLGTDGEVDLRYVTTVLVSTAATAGPGGNADSGAPVLDPDGDFCAFESAATNLIAGFQAAATPGRTNIYSRSFGTGARALLSHAIGQASRGADGDSKRPSISSIGGVVTFDSDAADLVVDDTNGRRDVFVTDVGGATTVRRASVRTGGEQVDLDSVFGSVFVDGTTAETWIAFQSIADFGDGGAKPAIYVHQLSTTSTTRVGGSVAIANPARFTPDGGRLAFVTEAALDSANVDANGIDDLVALDFVGFRADGRQKFARATRSVIGADANGASANAATGAMRAQDGTFTSDQLYVFTTAATNLGRSAASDVLVDFAVDRSVARIAAEFTSSVTRGVAPFAMAFVDRSNNATAWSWDFGDGQTSTEQNPTHVYTTPGSYTVALTVTGGAATATATKTAFAQATATPLTWASIYSTYSLASGCASSSCHNGATSARFSMTTATTAYNNMVGVNSVRLCAPQKRVATGTADNSGNSVLPRVLVSPQDCVSFRMGSLSPQAVHDIIDWIDNGVPR